MTEAIGRSGRVVGLNPLPAGLPDADVSQWSVTERLIAANGMALDQVARSAKDLVLHPGKAVIATLHGMEQMATRPGQIVEAVRRTAAHNKVDGGIMAGRVLAGYAGLIGMTVGVGALAGRLGAGALGRQATAEAFQVLGQRGFATAGKAGLAAIGIDGLALGVHEVAAARADSHEALKEAAHGLHQDMGSLALNAGMAGAGAVGGAGMRVLARSLQERQIAGSLAAIRGQTQGARLMGEHAITSGKRAPRLASELREIMGDAVAHVTPKERVALGEFMRGKLSPNERLAAAEAMAGLLEKRKPITDVLNAGENAVWRTSGVSQHRLTTLAAKGWDASSLGDLRQAIRHTKLPEGVQAQALRRASARAMADVERTAANGSRLVNRTVRAVVVDRLRDVGLTCDVSKLSVTDLDLFIKTVTSADPKNQKVLIQLANQTKGPLDVGAFWLKAYETLYADLGVDPAVYRALADRIPANVDRTALDRVYSQLKGLPGPVRAQVSKAVAAMEIRPGTTATVMRQANTEALATLLREALPPSQASEAGRVASQLVSEVSQSVAGNTRKVWRQAAMQMVGKLAMGQTTAVSQFAREVGGARAFGESVITGLTSAVARMPAAARTKLFAGLKTDVPVSTQITSRLAKQLQRDFRVTVNTKKAYMADGYPIKPMDAAGALHLYNSLLRIAGPKGFLPQTVRGTTFGRIPMGSFGGLALTSEGTMGRHTLLTDLGVGGSNWSEAAGVPRAEGIWTHEVYHQLLRGGSPLADQAMVDWAKLGDWRHASALDDSPIVRGSAEWSDLAGSAYKDPTIEGNLKEVVSRYGATDPAEDWSEFGRLAHADPVATFQQSPPKFLFLVSRMPSPPKAVQLKAWALEAGIDLAQAKQLLAQRLGADHPVLAKVTNLLR